MSVTSAEFVKDDAQLKAFIAGVVYQKQMAGSITKKEGVEKTKEIWEEVRAQREGKTPAQLAKVLEAALSRVLGSIAADTLRYFFPVDKFGGQAAKNINAIMGQGARPINIANSEKRNAPLLVMADKMPNVEFKGEVSQVDILLHNVLCSFYEAGAGYVTMNAVYKKLFGRKPSQAQQEKLKKQISRQGGVRIVIDATKAKGAFGDRVVNVDAAMLNYTIKKVRLAPFMRGGKLIERYEERLIFLQEPPLLTNAKALKQYSAIPMKVFEALPQNVLSEGTAARINYLNLRIARMKKKGGGRILWETYFAEVAPDAAKYMHEARERKAALQVLDTFKAAGIIKKYVADEEGITIETQDKKTKN